jgi:hypothetical protein
LLTILFSSPAQIQTPEAIADDLDSLGKTDSAEFMRNELDHQIKLALVDVMKVGSAQPVLLCNGTTVSEAAFASVATGFKPCVAQGPRLL